MKHDCIPYSSTLSVAKKDITVNKHTGYKTLILFTHEIYSNLYLIVTFIKK